MVPEYLIKQYLQTAKTQAVYREMYDQTVDAIQKYLVTRSEPNGLVYIGEIMAGSPDIIYPKMDHLVCFIGGMLALGATEGPSLSQEPILTSRNKNDLELGRDITRTCFEMYNTTATGLASEIVYFNMDPDKMDDIIIQPLDRHNLLRPETLESLFVMWRITGDEIYR